MAISDLQNMTRGNVTEPPIMVYEGPISDANGLPAGSGVIISQGPIHTRVDTITRSGSGDIIATQQVLRFGKWVVPMIADDATRTVVSLGDSASKGRALRYWDVATGEDLANGKNVRSQRASALGIAFPVQSA